MVLGESVLRIRVLQETSGQVRICAYLSLSSTHSRVDLPDIFVLSTTPCSCRKLVMLQSRNV